MAVSEWMRGTSEVHVAIRALKVAVHPTFGQWRSTGASARRLRRGSTSAAGLKLTSRSAQPPRCLAWAAEQRAWSTFRSPRASGEPFARATVPIEGATPAVWAPAKRHSALVGRSRRRVRWRRPGSCSGRVETFSGGSRSPRVTLDAQIATAAGCASSSPSRRQHSLGHSGRAADPLQLGRSSRRGPRAVTSSRTRSPPCHLPGAQFRAESGCSPIVPCDVVAGDPIAILRAAA